MSPASPPSHQGVVRGVEVRESSGCSRVGRHVFDHWEYMAGQDEDRVCDLNSALGDPGVRAVIATRGGKGAYRIVDDLVVDDQRRDPKPSVGFSDITHLHPALWERCGLAPVARTTSHAPPAAPEERTAGCGASTA
ncbi:LD-carboxypeptidase [Streptomyces griseoluteus]|uniref:LD-carboxypeptidase n=1 Tax=Streptomyces griseoluteus TaxID=29306 RepID=UPI0036FFDD19